MRGAQVELAYAGVMGGVLRASVPALIAGEFAVHRPHQMDRATGDFIACDKGWVVSHARTGCSILPAPGTTKTKAVAIARALNRIHAPWVAAAWTKEQKVAVSNAIRRVLGGAQ